MARDLADITVLEVLEAVEGSIGVSPCSEDPRYCARSGECAYHRVWCGADRMLVDYFGSITLRDLSRCARASAQPGARAPGRLSRLNHLCGRNADDGKASASGERDSRTECFPRRGVAEVAGVEWPEKGLCREAFIESGELSGIVHYRDLPWRHIDDPYAVLVSEVVCGQTQVARVERFWRRFGRVSHGGRACRRERVGCARDVAGGSVITVGRFPSSALRISARTIWGARFPIRTRVSWRCQRARNGGGCHGVRPPAAGRLP